MKIQTVSDLLHSVNRERAELIARENRRRDLLIAWSALALICAALLLRSCL